jgi:hypothetical protein
MITPAKGRTEGSVRCRLQFSQGETICIRTDAVVFQPELA